MNTWKKFIPISFAIVFAILSSVSVYQFLRNRNTVSHAATPQITMIPVVIAKNPIAIGEKVDEKDLEMVSWPEEAVPDTSYRSIKSITGRTSRNNISASEPILESKLLAEGENFSSLIPKGMRAVTVAIGRSAALAQILERGGTVDVLSLYTFNGTGIVTAETIVEHARVLGVHKAGGADDGSIMSSSESSMDITLIVSPEEAKRIVAAQKQGGVEIIVRNDEAQEELLTNGESNA